MIDTLTQLRAGKLAGTRRLDLSCGLTELPQEVFDLADSLEVLNLTGNRLSSLPDELTRLKKLRIIFCSENQFTHLPEVLGSCPQLSMIGFKSNQIETVNASSLPPSLRWLILTDNRVRTLPASLGQCSQLQKLMLSCNRLRSLPEEMAACQNLEMIRLAANDFHSLPEWLLNLPRLAWLALAGNPCAPMPDVTTLPMRTIHWNELKLIEQLGEGASGIIHRAEWLTESRPVAVKIFKGQITSDGLPESELAASLTTGSHPNLIEILGRITDHPEQAAGLAMALINPEFKTLAGPPSLESCTRDVYPNDQTFTLPVALRIAQGLASAAKHLHGLNITHGDFYAHNVLWNEAGNCTLGDFGAASFYTQQYGQALQQIEVRAFGYLLEELLSRITGDSTNQALWDLQARCCSSDPKTRPLFAEIHAELLALSKR